MRHWRANTLGIIFSLVWVFPVYWMVNTAFKPRSEVMTSTPTFFPSEPTLHNFIVAVSQTNFLLNLRNSVIVVSITVAVSVLLGLFAAAALARFRVPGRRPIMVILLLVQMIPIPSLLIPMFLVFNEVGLLGPFLGLLLAYVATVLPFSIWVMRGFYVGIPL